MAAMLEGWRRTVAVLTSMAAGAVASPASAQPTAKDRQAASALVTKAIARADAGDHEGAIKLYREAYDFAPDPALLTNIASQLVESGKAEEALHYFCMYLELAPGGSNVPFATSKAKALQIRLGNKTVEDDNVCAPPKPPRDRGSIEITAPGPGPGPSAGETTGGPTGGTIEGPRDESTLNYPAVVTGIAGLAALGVGVYAGIKAKSISDQITNHPMNAEWENDIKSIQARGQRYEYIQIGTLIGGGALAVTSVILFVRSRGSHDKPTVSLTPTIGGVAVLGTF
jgi:hypothetical protein